MLSISRSLQVGRSVSSCLYHRSSWINILQCCSLPNSSFCEHQLMNILDQSTTRLMYNTFQVLQQHLNKQNEYFFETDRQDFIFSLLIFQCTTSLKFFKYSFNDIFICTIMLFTEQFQRVRIVNDVFINAIYNIS